MQGWPEASPATEQSMGFCCCFSHFAFQGSDRDSAQACATTGDGLWAVTPFWTSDSMNRPPLAPYPFSLVGLGWGSGVVQPWPSLPERRYPSSGVTGSCLICLVRGGIQGARSHSLFMKNWKSQGREVIEPSPSAALTKGQDVCRTMVEEGG